jgi:hypothetical protein
MNALVGCLILIAVVVVFSIRMLNKEHEWFQELLAKDSRFHPSHQVLGAGGETGLAIDAASRKVCLVTMPMVIGPAGGSRVYSFDDVLACELVEDGSTVTRTSRASQATGMVVGGVLLGGAGVLVGGLSGSTRTTAETRRIELRLIINNIDKPSFIINFGTGRDEAFAWYARMKVVIEQNEAATAKPHTHEGGGEL